MSPLSHHISRRDLQRANKDRKSLNTLSPTVLAAFEGLRHDLILNAFVLFLYKYFSFPICFSFAILMDAFYGRDTASHVPSMYSGY